MSLSAATRLTQYDPHSFADWLYEVKTLCRVHSLKPPAVTTPTPSAVASPSDVVSADPADGKEDAVSVEQRKARVLLAIFQSVPKTLRYLVHSANTIDDAVAILRDHAYAAHGDGKLALKMAWGACKLSGAKTFEAYAATVSTLVHRQRCLSSNSPDLPEDLAVSVLSTVDTLEYASLKARILEDNNWKRWTPATILAALRRVSDCRKSAVGTNATAMVAPVSTLPRATQVCTYCQQRGFNGNGHNYGRCRRRRRDSSKTKKTKEAAKLPTTSAMLAPSSNQVVSSSPQCFSLLSSARSLATGSDSPTTTLTGEEVWVLDSGATHHITGSNAGMYDTQSTNVTVHALGADLTANSKGTVAMSISDSFSCTLSDTLFVPGLRHNLLSVPAMSRRGFSVSFGQSGARVCDGQGRTIMRGVLQDGLFLVQLSRDMTPSSTALVSATRGDSSASILSSVHGRLNHVHLAAMKKAVRLHPDQFSARERKVVRSAKTIECEACMRGKPRRSPFKKSSSHYFPLQLLATDICGPFDASTEGYRYAVSFIDVATRVILVYFLKTRSSGNVLAALQSAVAKFEKLADYEYTVRGLRSDNAKEYASDVVETFCRERGIVREYSVPYAHQQNGIAERFFRTLQEGMHTCLAASGLPFRFWPQAMHHTAMARNQLPSASLSGAVPIRKLSPRPPPALCFQPFGCAVITQTSQEVRRKSGSPTDEGIFVGQSLQHKDGILVLDLLSNYSTSCKPRRTNQLEPSCSLLVCVDINVKINTR